MSEFIKHMLVARTIKALAPIVLLALAVLCDGQTLNPGSSSGGGLTSNQVQSIVDNGLAAVASEEWYGTTNAHPTLSGALQFSRTTVASWTNIYSATAATNYLGTLYMTNSIAELQAGTYQHLVNASASDTAGNPRYYSVLVMSDGVTTNVLSAGTSFLLSTAATPDSSYIILSTNVVRPSAGWFVGVSRYVVRTSGGGTASIFGGAGYHTHLSLPFSTIQGVAFVGASGGSASNLTVNGGNLNSVNGYGLTNVPGTWVRTATYSSATNYPSLTIAAPCRPFMLRSRNCRSTTNNTFDTLWVRCDGDAGANRYFDQKQYRNSATTGTASIDAAQIQVCLIEGLTATNTAQSIVWVKVWNPSSTNTVKHIWTEGAVVGAGSAALFQSETHWAYHRNDTGAMQTITVFPGLLFSNCTTWEVLEEVQ